MTTPTQARMGHDVGDFADLIWAKSFGPALGSADAPEPDEPSPPCRVPSLSQDECPYRGKHHWWPHGDILKCMKCNKRIPREKDK